MYGLPLIQSDPSTRTSPRSTTVPSRLRYTEFPPGPRTSTSPGRISSGGADCCAPQTHRYSPPGPPLTTSTAAPLSGIHT